MSLPNTSYQYSYNRTVNEWQPVETLNINFVDNVIDAEDSKPVILAAAIEYGYSDLAAGWAPKTWMSQTFDGNTRLASLDIAVLAIENDNGSDSEQMRAVDTASDNLATSDNRALPTASVLYAFDGSTFDRVRSASAANQSAATKTAPLQVASPGTWSITHAPAVNTQATITRAAGSSGVRHVCTAITATLIAPEATQSTVVQLNLRDGASGAGTILKSFTLQVGGTASISCDRAIIQLSGLQIVGSSATAMTLEFSAAGGAGTFESVSLEGYDVN